MGLDKHPIIQYFVFWQRTLQLDFGYSFRYGVPTTRVVFERLPNSLRLGGAAVVLGIALGLPLGILAALRRGTMIDTAATMGAVLGIVTPQFFLAIVLILIFSVHFRLLPTSGVGTWKHLVLPAVTLSTGLIATVARIARSGMLEALGQDYVRTARAKGLSERAVIFGHALAQRQHVGHHRNAFLAAASDRHRRRGGSCIFLARRRQPDGPVGDGPRLSVVFLDVILFSVLTVVTFLIMDIVYVMVDPRVRHH